jgi:hypothetical protein
MVFRLISSTGRSRSARRPRGSWRVVSKSTMRAGGLSPLGSGGKVVEADETFYGSLEGRLKKGWRAWSNENVVFTLVEHGGSASFHVNGVRAGDLSPIIRGNLSRKAKLHTDEMHSYKFVAEVENPQPQGR